MIIKKREIAMDNDFINLLLIDDDEQEHLIIRRILNSIQKDHSNIHYSIHFSEDYFSGLSEIFSKQYDICLVDYRLGNDDGLGLIRAAIKKESEMPMILLTDQNNQDIEYAAINAGAMDYLNKNEINEQLLRRSIQYAIERKKIETQLKKLGH